MWETNSPVEGGDGPALARGWEPPELCSPEQPDTPF